MSTERQAVLLIAHGSRRAEANADLRHVAAELLQRQRYPIVEVSYLELAEPTIAEGGEACVQAGATEVIMVPYFLSAGVHAREDMIEARAELASRFPDVLFRLAEPLGRHPALIDIVEQRARAAETSPGQSEQAPPQ
jgi:sirohydrochlorin ferrochelatase